MPNPPVETRHAAHAGLLLDSGAGRGIGFMFVASSLVGIVVSILAYAHPRIRNIEDELPDALPASAD